MKQIIFALLVAFALSACGSSEEAPPPAAKPVQPANEYFVWADPGIASGNFEADYADCTAQIEKDPAITPQTPELARLAAYMQCMAPKGWKFVGPNETAQP